MSKPTASQIARLTRKTAQKLARRSLASLASLPEGLRAFWAGSAGASIEADVAAGNVVVIVADDRKAA